MKKQLSKKQGAGTVNETKTSNPPKQKTRTVTTNPGGYSKTIVKTKTVDRPGKQAEVTTTKTRPTVKGIASDYASGVRSSFYDLKEKIGEKRADIKNNRAQRAATPSPRQVKRASRKS